MAMKVPAVVFDTDKRKNLTRTTASLCETQSGRQRAPMKPAVSLLPSSGSSAGLKRMPGYTSTLPAPPERIYRAPLGASLSAN